MRLYQTHHYRRIAGRCLNQLTISRNKRLVTPATARYRHHVIIPPVPCSSRQAEHRCQLTIGIIDIQPLHISRQRLIRLITPSFADVRFLSRGQERPDFIIGRFRRTAREFGFEERPFEGDAFAAGKGFRHMAPIGRQRRIRAGGDGKDHRQGVRRHASIV
ncbi:hypothetical protein HmCmsJML015_04589 [Escherichia coli]|nr:hypothetical protein HmCmsJML015_04589 [Escherichia coli]